MTIQVGVPGNAGGTSGGLAATEIAQAGGRVTVEADGSITISPLDGFPVIAVKGTANNNAPHFAFDDDTGAPNGYVGAEDVAGGHLDDSSLQSMILAAQGALFIGIFGETSSFDITNSGVEMKAPRWLVTQAGPHAWGQAFAGNDKQYEFAGSYVGGGFSAELAKMKLTGILTGAPGDTDGIFGLLVAPELRTQTATEGVAVVAGIKVPVITLVDNLTGSIAETAGLHIAGPMAGGLANYAILADTGLSKLGSIWASEVGPHVFGQSFVSQAAQFQFSGPFTVGGSDASKVEVGNSLTGVAGTQRYRGLHQNSSFATQANTDTIFNISQIDLPVPTIIDNLTGGVGIVQAATLRIQGAPSAGNANFALIVEAGLTELFNLDHAGTLLGFYATPGVVKPTVTGAKGGNAALTSLIAALLGQGLIADTTT